MEKSVFFTSTASSSRTAALIAHRAAPNEHARLHFHTHTQRGHESGAAARTHLLPLPPPSGTISRSTAPLKYLHRLRDRICGSTLPPRRDLSREVFATESSRFREKKKKKYLYAKRKRRRPRAVADARRRGARHRSTHAPAAVRKDHPGAPPVACVSTRELIWKFRRELFTEWFKTVSEDVESSNGRAQVQIGDWKRLRDVNKRPA